MSLLVSSEELRESNALIEKFEEGRWKNLRHDEMEVLFEDIMDHIKILLCFVSKYKDESEYLKEDLSIQKRENENLQEHIEAISQEYENIKKMYSDLEDKYNENSLENSFSKSLINELEAEKVFLNNEKYEKDENILNLRERMKDRDNEIEEMRRKVSELSNQIINSEKELLSEKKITQGLSKNLESNHEETYNLKERIMELESECDYLKSRQEELQFEYMAKVENSMKATSMRGDSDAIMECSHEDIDDHEIMRNIEEAGIFFSNKICEISGINMNNDLEEYSPHRRKTLHSEQVIPPKQNKSLKPKAEFSTAKNTAKIVNLKPSKISGSIKIEKNQVLDKKNKNKKLEGQRRSSGNSPMSSTSVKLHNILKNEVKSKKGNSITLEDNPSCQTEKEIERLKTENADIKIQLAEIKKYMLMKCDLISQLEGEVENSNDNEKKILKELEECKKELFKSEEKEFEISHAFEKYKKTQKDFRLELIQERDRYEAEIFELTDVCNEFKEAHEKSEIEKESLSKIVMKMKEEIKESKKKMIEYEENIKNAFSTKIEGVFERIIEQQKEEVEVYESPERAISQKSRNNNSLRAHHSDPTDNDMKNDEFLDRSSNIETAEWPSVLDLNEKGIKRHHKMSEDIMIDGKVLNENNDTSFLNAFDEPDICPTLVFVDKVIDVCLDMVKSKESKEVNTVYVSQCNQESNTEYFVESKEMNTEPIRNNDKEIMTEKYVEEQEMNTDQKFFINYETHTSDLIGHSEMFTETNQLINTVEAGVHASNLTETFNKETNTESKESESVETNTESKESESVETNTESKESESVETNTESKESESVETNTESKESESVETNTESKESESVETNTESKESESVETNTESKESESVETNTESKESESVETNTESKESESVETNTEIICHEIGINTIVLNEHKLVNTDLLHTLEESTITCNELKNFSVIDKVYSINEFYGRHRKFEMVSNVLNINEVFLRVKINKQMKYDKNVINIHENFENGNIQKVLLILESKVFSVCENYFAQSESRRAKLYVSKTLNICIKPEEILNEKKEEQCEETFDPCSKTELKYKNSKKVKIETEEIIKFINEEQQEFISLPFLKANNNMEEQIVETNYLEKENLVEEKYTKNEKESSILVEENKVFEEKEVKNFGNDNQLNSERAKSFEIKIKNCSNENKNLFFLNVSKINKNNLEIEEAYQMSSNRLRPKTKTLSLYYSPMMSPRLRVRNALDFTEILSNKKRTLKKQGESITIESLINSFKWNFSKLYEIEAEICEGNEVLQDTLILSGKGLASVLKNECFISKMSNAKFIKDSKFYILGNSEIVIESNSIWTKKCSRSYFDGNMGEHSWKIKKITIYS